MNAGEAAAGWTPAMTISIARRAFIYTLGWIISRIMFLFQPLEILERV